MKLYLVHNNVRDSNPVATTTTNAAGYWQFQWVVSGRGANFTGYDVVQQPTPGGYTNYFVDATGCACQESPEEPRNAAARWQLAYAAPPFTAPSGAIYFLRRLPQGSSLETSTKLPVKGNSKTTYYIGGVYEVDGDGTTRSYFGAGGASALRTISGGAQSVLYLHGDHLGSVSLATDSTGNKVSEQEFDPWGGVRSGGVSQTTHNYTGQQLDSTGLLYYHARYYDPGLARFVSADSIVPGMAVAAGGFGAIGTDDSASMKGLTVDYHETGFAAAANGENAMTLQRGFYFQLSNDDKQKAKSSAGPLNPQALNRYSYVLNNPLRYTDPTGHGVYLTKQEAKKLAHLLNQLAYDMAKGAQGQYVRSYIEALVAFFLPIVGPLGNAEGLAASLAALSAIELQQIAEAISWYADESPEGIALSVSTNAFGQNPTFGIACQTQGGCPSDDPHVEDGVWRLSISWGTYDFLMGISGKQLKSDNFDGAGMYGYKGRKITCAEASKFRTWWRNDHCW